MPAVEAKTKQAPPGAGYKFRADYSGTQTYSDPILVVPDVNNPVEIPVGGSAALEELDVIAKNPAPVIARSPISGQGRRGDPDGVQVASLFLFPGLLAQASNSAFADSNGEYLYYYHSDHLGTPLFLTDTDGVAVWKGEYLPFGGVFVEDKDPDGDGVHVEQPFRFPGQYHDQETGLYYNYFRDYNPALGRYVEADPIGLAGGVNQYLYVIASPIFYTDSRGLKIDWGDIVLTNSAVKSNLEKLNKGLIEHRGADDFTIRVTGGDRYIDSQGKHRSCTDNSVVKDSDPESPHLLERGARGVDFSPDGTFTFDQVKSAMNKTDFRSHSDSVLLYKDGHVHLNLPNLIKYGGEY